MMNQPNPFLRQWLISAVAMLLTLTLLSFIFNPSKPEQAAGQISLQHQQINVTNLDETNMKETSPDTKMIPEKPQSVALSERISEYHINVKLDEDNKQLIGTETISWKHPGVEPVKEVYLHLYANAFESEQTTFFKESGGMLRNDKMTERSFGGIEIVSIKDSNGEEFNHRTQFVQPDDQNEHDHTLMKVRLAEAINPNQELRLTIQFQVNLPEVYARMGYKDHFIMAGQWFPKLAKYERKGVRGRTEEGWNLHQYHGNSEFYSDFSIYNVKIDVPKDYIVAATGFPASTAKLTGDRKMYHFYAEDVHDFAWAASPDFIYVEEPYSTQSIPGVKIKLYLDPAHEHLKDRYFFAAKRALSNYSEWYGAYPYSTLSIVVPPQGANGAGGMEYPTLITAWGADRTNPGHELERVVVHEIGHQFFHGMVATNEFEEAWLDEAFTSYAEDKVMEKDFDILPATPIESIYITNPAPLKQNAWEYNNHQHYADNVYTRGKLVLLAIEKEIGSQLMQQVMRTYFQQWKFKHPSTENFQAILEKVSQREWDRFFDQFVYGGQMTDYSIESIRSEKRKVDGKTQYTSTVSFKRLEGHYTKVPITFHFADGKELTKMFDGNDEQWQYKIKYDAKLEWVWIDPQYEMPLEHIRTNNFMKAEIAPQEAIKWNTAAIQWIETLIGLWAW